MIYPQTYKPHSKLAYKKTSASSILTEQKAWSDNKSTINAEGEIHSVSTFKISSSADLVKKEKYHY